MNSQEVEVALKVLEERQNIHDSRLKDVDECCGKLKGALNSEMRIVNERIVKVEHGIDTNCKDVEIQMKALQEQTKTQFNKIGEVQKDEDKLTQKIDELNKKLDDKISKITQYYITFTIGILTAIIISVISIIN